MTDITIRKEANTSPMRSSAAALVGNAFEYYDYFLYTTAAALVFGKLFFAFSGPANAVLVALASYAVGFLSRPLGGVFFGRLGDKFGRKRLMMATLTLMGVATVSIGLLPTYDQIGIMAPVLLVVLRLVQGFAAGGEWGGALLIATENAPYNRRGFYGAWSQAGIGLGFVLASSAFYLAQQLPGNAFLDWGWRLPFLFSVVIFAVGLYIRHGVEETADFVDAVEQGGPAREPLTLLFSQSWRQLITAIGVRLAEMSNAHITTTFAMAYGAAVGLKPDLLVLAVAVSMLTDTVMMLVYGHLSDRIGRRTTYFIGLAGTALFAAPFFALLGSATAVGIFAALIVANGLLHSAMVSIQPGLLVDLFPAQVRSSGISLAQSITSIIAGFLPLICMSLYLTYKSTLPVVVIQVMLCAITAAALAIYPKMRVRSAS